ncbi:MAG: iron-containing alcohol dehydrogenase [Spirochaetales bacterium]
MNLISPFSFDLPTRIEFGMGTHKRVAEILRNLNLRRVLVITDSGISQLSWFTQILDSLLRGDFLVEVFDRIEQNPKDKNVIEAAEVAKQLRAEGLLAIGGGSPIDCAKVASILAVYGGTPRYYEDRNRIGPYPLPIVAIPTTAGTGSEVTFGGVITDTDAKFKFTVKSPLLAPRVALVDPELTLSLPPSLTAATGMDALTHAVEAYTSKASEPIADACALYAAELIAQNLPTVVCDGTNLQARSAVLLGSLLAGIAFSHSDVGAVHCIAEALGGMYDLPHGVCNAVCLPFVMEYCLEANLDRYARLGRAMGVLEQRSLTTPYTSSRPTNATLAQATVVFVRALAQAVGLPSFQSFRVPSTDYPIIAEKAQVNGSNQDNIPVLTKADYLNILNRLAQ